MPVNGAILVTNLFNLAVYELAFVFLNQVLQ